MKTLNQYIQEKLIINKDYHYDTIVVKSFDELRKIIDDRYKKLGPGTKENPIDFNDIDVSHIRSFCNNVGNGGIFDNTFFKYIDISGWDVSNVTNMSCMFAGCEKLESVGDISNWDVSKVTNMAYMFEDCEKLKSVGDISDWDVSKVTIMTFMFYGCASFNQDISGWDVSKVTATVGMFDSCPIKEEYKPKFK